MNAMKKILVIKQGALGDFISSTGLLTTLRAKYSEARIDLLTDSSLMEMGRQMGIFHSIYHDNRTRFNIVDWYRICKKVIADGQYDAVVDLQRSNRTRVRYPFFVSLFTRRKIEWLVETRDIFGTFPIQSASLEFCQGEEKHFALLPERFVLVVPGCSAQNKHKRWPKEYYADIVQRLAAQGIHSVILGTKAEAEEVNFIASASEYAVNFLGKSSLLDIPSLAKKSMLIIGNDTGPTHMASLVGTQAIVLFPQKTAASTIKLDNITNLIGPLISDISVETVWHHVTLCIPSLSSESPPNAGS